MEVHSNDSKKLFKVFDASKRKRTRKKREGLDESNSVGTDESHSACPANVGRSMSGKTSLQDLPTADTVHGHSNDDSAPREKCSCSSIPRDERRSPRHHRRAVREGMSLALKAGMVSTPRSVSPVQDKDAEEKPAGDEDSFIYAFLEDAIKRDKKRHRHGRKYEEQKSSRDREKSESRDHHHRHRKRREEAPPKERDKPHKEHSPVPAIDQTVLLETFAKLCAQMKEKTTRCDNNSPSPVQRTQSHKSLQCEVISRRNSRHHDVDRHPERLPSDDHDRTPTCIRSQENFRQDQKYSSNKIDTGHATCTCCYDELPKYDSKINYKESKYMTKMGYGKEPKYESKINVNCSRAVVNSRLHEEDRYRSYPPEQVATRTFIDHRDYRDRPRDLRDYHDYERRHYDDDRRRYVDQKTSRSFDVHRDPYDEERCRRTARSDIKDKRYDNKYYEKPIEAPERHFSSKERRARKPSDRFDRNSIASRDEDRDRDRYSEKERDSGLSVADGDTSTLSGRTGRSIYLRTVKQEIAEQREAMDKMMKLWKELMRCFKGISQTQDKDKTVNESTCENVRESAAAQLRLWRECMRRYETVARDVGDTDARLMEEISKQRSEMSEMATMWQECLQRYRDMSNDFNKLKQQLVTAESPTRLPATAGAAGAGLVCAEGEGAAPAPLAPPPPSPHYRVPLPPNYPQLPPSAGYGCVGSPLRGRASAPPAWWWGAEGAPPRSPRRSPRRRSSRRSSPDSRDGDRDRRHRHKDFKDTREDPRYKDKPHKPTAARSEHRRRKR